MPIKRFSLERQKVKASLSKGRITVDSSSGVTIDPEVKFKVPYAFCKIDKGTTFKLKYVKERWHWLNTELFGSKMVEPHFVVGKAFKNPKTLGHWKAYTKELLIANKIFLLPYDKQVLGTLVHEMSHQYDSEILQTPVRVRMIKGGHGPSWDYVMKSVGMPPDDKFAGDSTELLDEQQKENLEIKKANPKDAPNKITPESFGKERYIPALYITNRGTTQPIILLNKRLGSNRDVYAYFDKKDIISGYHGYPNWVLINSCMKPTPSQLKKFPSEFNTIRALENIRYELDKPDY
jgi:hypothetical protein